MASGCIVSTACPVCGEIVYEDEQHVINDEVIHNACRREYIQTTYHISEEQFRNISGLRELREEIQALKQSAADFHEWTKRRAEELEGKLAASANCQQADP